MKYAILLIAAVAAAQEPDKTSVNLTDPSRPATLKVESMRGDITVHGYDGREVVVTQKGAKGEPRRRRGPAELDGLKRIDLGNEFKVEEKDNVVTVNTGLAGGDVEVQIPRSALLKLKTLTGEVVVEGVRGEVEANSMNGDVKLKAIEGSVVAHSLNGNVIVTLMKLEQKPMSFSTMNGDIEVTMPGDSKARLKIRNDLGELYTDFDLKAQGREEKRDEKGNVRFDRSLIADINGGGPEISFRSYNGKIKIRKAK